MKYRPIPIQPPSVREEKALRLMIFMGVGLILFLLYTMLQKKIISNYPLYLLLMITLVYYCGRYLHEWYHYFSISADKKPVGSKKYTVDILTTYCAGEPFDMLEDTLTAIQNITYAHTAWCCDEADDPHVKQLCVRLGIRHVTRTDKNDAKAGNINNALQYATGDLCVVLDPDHIPAPEFLDQLVVYFDDPSIGFVQIVQAYYNQGQSLVAKGAAQQTYQFYGPMMMSMHKYGTVQAIGANCTFRRAALDSIGGHASGLAEDMHTAMQMHARGWHSVYVPAILTRGLVPATMSSYYKQQLKWSRGTWELLVATYPKLFSKFTWRQKLHYFTLPFHYLSGVIFFINFLIPVVSLFTGYYPLQMDLVTFILTVFPLFIIGVLIRQYVQKWVPDERDRGFHLVGGILQIGAWWVHSVGFIYTILRKKVPYIPTPKNDNDPLPLLMSLPNLLVAVISLMAIVYSFWHDYNPYNFFMALLTAMQVVFMGFILSISGYIDSTGRANRIVKKVRKNTRLIVKSHGFLRVYSLQLSIFMIILFGFGIWKQQELPVYLPRPLEEPVFYRGLYSQSPTDDRIVNKIFSIADQRKDIAIISFDILWGDGEKNQLDTALLQQVYNLDGIPLLAWKLWQKESGVNTPNDTAVMQHISDGKYDGLISSFATQVARLERPVFLRFCNKPDQNRYPLFAPVNCKPEDFIAAWRHVHYLFDSAGADKVIWIWNPWDAATANDYFPGRNYVDWLGVNIVDTCNDRLQANINSFDTIYRPYHLSKPFTSGLPIMVTEIVSHSPSSREWYDVTWKTIDNTFREIKSLIVDPTDYLNNNKQVAVNPFVVKTIFQNAPKASMPLTINETDLPKASEITATYPLMPAIKSVVYDKGYNWFRNRHTLGLETTIADVSAMKKIGINTIERTMPGIYDYNLRKAIVSNKMNLIPHFRLYGNPEVVADERQMIKQKEMILASIKGNLDKKHIIAWNIGDDVLHSLANQTYKPDYFYYQQKYVSWLADICRRIRLLDTVRPIIMDLHWDTMGRERFYYYKKHVPYINNYMLVADSKYKAGLKEPLEKGMVWGKVEMELWPLVSSIRQSGTIPAWQDIENTEYISLTGLLDLDGRKKQWYWEVADTWGKKQTGQVLIPDIKILKPNKITTQSDNLRYYVLYKKNDINWQRYNGEVKGLRFEWSLVTTDQYGNTMFIKEVGEGPSIELSIPIESQYYKLYVEAILGEEVKIASITLNTPL